MITIDGFDYFAFVVMAVLFGTVVSLIVWLGSLPGKIAARRGHPYASGISAASWLSFLTLGVLWPLAFVWAFVPPRASPATTQGESAS